MIQNALRSETEIQEMGKIKGKITNFPIYRYVTTIFKIELL